MANATVNELRTKSDAVWDDLGRVLQGMEGHLEQADAPGEWTARQVLCHLLFEPGWKPVAVLERFTTGSLPLIEITPGVTSVTAERQRMSLAELTAALDDQRREIFAYLETLSDQDLGRKARIPVFQPLLGTDEVPLPAFVGGVLEYHWRRHIEQLEKIRAAAGLPAVGVPAPR